MINHLLCSEPWLGHVTMGTYIVHYAFCIGDSVLILCYIFNIHMQRLLSMRIVNKAVATSCTCLAQRAHVHIYGVHPPTHTYIHKNRASRTTRLKDIFCFDNNSYDRHSSCVTSIATGEFVSAWLYEG